MSGLNRLPALLWTLLGCVGAVWSAAAAGVEWLGQTQTDVNALVRSLAWGDRIGVRTAAHWYRLVNLDAEQEERWLRETLARDERHLKAMLREALRREFAGELDEARRYSQKAVAYHRSFQSYMAALSQAVRLEDGARVPELAAGALRYCPRDADAVYELVEHSVLREVVAQYGRQRDYLRFLVARQELARALEYEACVPEDAATRQLRLELTERLWLGGQRSEAAAFFGRLAPEFAQTGAYNLNLATEPSGLGFDWRRREAGARATWRPGELEVVVEEQAAEVDLLSLVVERRAVPRGQAEALWTGDTQGMRWRVEELGGEWRRVVLVAGPGGRRRVRVAGVVLR